MTAVRADDDQGATERAMADARRAFEARRPSPALRERVRGRLFANGRTVPAPRVRSRYRILSLLGEGGMGKVFEAYDEAQDLPVALKRLTRREAELSFRREFHTLVTHRHPNIVEAFDYGVDDEGAFYTMELLGGVDLRALGRASVETTCTILRDVASALAFLHARRLVHRDLSLRNIRRSRQGCAKLIDFGLLSTVGAEAEIAGTPPYVAPETLRGHPLDHRVDLFALGAVAYFLLSGTHAFPAKSFADIARLHASLPAPVGKLREGIPSILDELVSRMLSIDPLGRPASAVEVIDRMGRLVGRSESDGDVVRGYMASTTFVGRQREMDLVRERATSAFNGRGGSLVFEATSGAGKSRLLREVAIEATLRGAVAVLVDGDAGQEPYAAFRSAVAKLQELAPDALLEVARPHLPRLGAVLPELGAAIGGRVESPRQERGDSPLAIQRELQEIVFAFAKTRPLTLLVDDVQRADEASLAVFASVTKPPPGAALLVVATRATDEQPRASVALADLLRTSDVSLLRGLGRDDIQSFVGALFGDVPNRAKLADVIHEAGGGSPLLCTEIAQHLVASGTVRYLDGMWVVPDDVAVDTLPKRLDDAMNARTASLSRRARDTARAIATYGRELSLALTVTLGTPRLEAEVFEAIDELVARGVLIGDGSVFRLAHRAVRDALLRVLGEDERRALHGRVADALAPALREHPELEGEVGYHMLKAGRAGEAAPLLYRAGKRLYEAQSLRDAIPILEAALTAYRDVPGSAAIAGELRYHLIVAGAMADRDLVLRQGDSAFLAAWRDAGLDVGERVARVLGRHIGILCALVVASIRKLLRPVERPSPALAIRNALTLATATFATYAHLKAFARMEPLLEHLRLFDSFRRLMPHFTYRVSLAMYELVSGRLASTRRHCDAALVALGGDGLIPLSKYERNAAEAVARNTRAWVAVIDHDRAFEHDIAAVERMDLPSFGFCCAVYRAIFHRHRGEEPLAQEMEARAERIRMQLGAPWMWEGVLWQQSSLAYAVTRDALGLKRCIEELTRMQDQGYELADFIDLARANYLREHGAVDDAWELLLALAARLPARSELTQYAMVARAETALARGDRAGAAQAAARVRALAQDPDSGLRSVRLRAVRVLALASVASESSFVALDEAIAEAESLGSPSLAGALHEAGVGLALQSHDDARLAKHHAGAERWYRPTRTPALIARLEQLRSLREARRSGPVSAAYHAHVIEALSRTIDAETRPV
jgi:hypothetical protein